MANVFNQDFRDFLIAFREAEVDYVLVGGYSVILHGYPRTTGDMDIWVRKTAANYQKIVQAFNKFGMPIFDMTVYNFLENDAFDVFSFGRPPVSISIITAIKGLIFEDAYQNAEDHEVEGLFIRLSYCCQTGGWTRKRHK